MNSSAESSDEVDAEELDKEDDKVESSLVESTTGAVGGNSGLGGGSNPGPGNKRFRTR